MTTALVCIPTYNERENLEGIVHAVLAADAMLEDDRVRDLLPAKRGVMRVVGRWVLSGVKDGA